MQSKYWKFAQAGKRRARLAAGSSRGGNEDSLLICLNAARVASAEVEPLKARKARDRSIDSRKTLDAALAREQVRAHAAHRGIAAHRHADRGPEMPHEERGQPLRGRRAQPAPRLVEIESIVPAFILDDTFENNGQQRTRAVRAVAR